jgi:glucose-6-phosphate isomerase
MNAQELWVRYKTYLCRIPAVGLSLDISRMRFDDGFFSRMTPAMEAAYSAMGALEGGAVANPDENRMVGHDWLRAPDLAPSKEIATEIRDVQAVVRQVTERVHAGEIKPEKSDRFTHLLSIGIGGSALGPMFVSDSPGDAARDPMRALFIDNTDPDGIARTSELLKDTLDKTLIVVMSKSGSTPETRKGKLSVAEAYRRQGLDFARHAIAVTGRSSRLDHQARSENWIASFPDVGLGRWPDERDVGRGTRAWVAPRHRHGRIAGRSGDHGRSDARPGNPQKSRRPPCPDVVPGDRRKRGEGHGRTSLQGSAPALQPISPAAHHGIVR